MNALIGCLRELVTANRILAREGVVDAYGHVSVRHPERPDRFFLSRSRSPELVTFDDILEFGLDGEKVGDDPRQPYLERFIHAGVYAARPDINAVVHNHAYEVIPFGVTGTRLRPLLHVAAPMGYDIPIWDIRDKFGDTNLLVVNMDHARDLATTLGPNHVVLMRGHGCTVAGPNIRRAVIQSVYAMVNARLQMQSMQMGGEVTYLTEAEVREATGQSGGPPGLDRAWEYLRRRAGCEEM